MSNSRYRREAQTQADADNERAARYQQAEKILEQHSRKSEHMAATVKKLVTISSDLLGMSDMEREMKSLDLIIKSGDLSREFEAYMLAKNMERVKRGESPEPIPRVGVSASTHRGAIHDMRKLLKARAEAFEQARINAANVLTESDKKKEQAAQVNQAPQTGTAVQSTQSDLRAAIAEEAPPRAAPGQSAAA